MSTAAESGRGRRPSTVTPIEPPLWVDSAAGVEWSDGADVLVVGWGAAGACAAIEARDAGADVLVVDRFGGGGASTLSGGVVYAGGGTPQQREAGFDDTPEAMADYLRHEVGTVVSEATLQRFCQDSRANLQWLADIGVRFAATMPDHKTSYPPDGKFLYYSGNEVVPSYAGSKPAAPRGHRVVARGQSGATLYAALRKATLARGARTLTQAAVRRLVCLRGPDGGPSAVLGVEAWTLPEGSPAQRRHAELDARIAAWRMFQPRKAERARQEQVVLEQAHARPRFLRARRAVVLSTGGYINNPQLIETHAPALRKGFAIGGSGCDGSGLRLGQGLGAAAMALDNISAWRFITPPSAWPRGLVVNARGERFCNEQVYGATLGHEMTRLQGGRAWLVLDARLRRQALLECVPGRLWAFQWLPALVLMLLAAKKGRSLPALAAAIGADAGALQASVAAANAAAHGLGPDPMGKSADMRQACDQAPFYALDISVNAKAFPMATLSLGGLRVDEDTGQVLSADGRGLPGLIAAGRTAIGLASRRYVSGLSLADCVFSGRRAGRAAATHRGQ